MYGKCRPLSIDRYKPHMTSLIIEARVTTYKDFIYLSLETTFPVHWSSSRVNNLDPGTPSLVM